MIPPITIMVAENSPSLRAYPVLVRVAPGRCGCGRGLRSIAAPAARRKRWGSRSRYLCGGSVSPNPTLSPGCPSMMRSSLLWLSERQSIFNFVRRNRLAKRFASRFVAGETISEGVSAARELAARGIKATLDLLGESVKVQADADQA